MKKLGISVGDLVEVFNDVGSTQAMAYPIATARPGQCFMLFCSPLGQVGSIISEHTNELIIPNYKNVWANIRHNGRAPTADRISFKALEYPTTV